MNKVITINLGGNAYQLEEGGYDALRAYLETAAARLAGNPDREEIISDIERAIADRFRALLASHKTVVETKEVATVLGDMGPIEADSGEARETGKGASAGGGGASVGGASSGAGAAETKTAEHGRPPRRLYRIHEGAMFAGVCNGIAAYLNIDPTFVRIGFVLLTMFWGAGLLLYVVMAIVVPEAKSPEEKSAASGDPATAQEYIRRAKEGYYEAMKHFPDRKARREWRRQFKREMRANANLWGHHWRSQWAEQAPAHPGAAIALPFLSLLSGVMAILFACAVISIVATHSVFGRPLPGGLPVWGAVAVLALLYGVLVGPLKIARYACRRGMGPPGRSRPFVFVFDAVIWVVLVAVAVCLVVHYFPELREAWRNLPSVAHQAMDDIRDWWNQK